MRGGRGEGVEEEEAEGLTSGEETIADGRTPLQIEMVADFAGIVLDKVPRVADIEHEV